MCCTKRYQTWIKSQKIHPLWLELKDRELQSKFDLLIRTHVFTIIKIVTAMFLVYSAFERLLNMHKEFNEQALDIVN